MTSEGNNEQRSLPPGWRMVKLGELCRLVNGDAYKESDWSREGIPIIRIQNLNDSTKPFNYWASSLEDRVEVNAGDVLLAWSGTPGTSFGTHIWRGGKAVLNQHIFRVDLDRSKILPDWAVIAINRQLEVMIGKAHGAVGLRHVTKNEVQALEIILPLLEEQKRIATILNEQMAAVERARAAAEAQLEAARTLPAAYLRAVFNSPEAQQWLKSRLGDAGEIVSGVTLGRKLKDSDRRKIPYLRVANVRDGHLDLTNVSRIEATEAEIAKLQLKAGDLLLTEGGDPDKLGRGTFWNDELPECIHQNHIFRVRFPLDRYAPEFVSAQIGSSYGKAYFLAHAKRTTGIATINQKVLSNFPLMSPSREIQRHIAVGLQEECQLAEKLRKHLEEEVETTNKLPAAILHRAFSGEL